MTATANGDRGPQSAVPARDSDATDTGTLFLDFEDNRLLSELFGEHDKNLAQIEARLGVSITPRGNRLAVAGPVEMRSVAQRVMNDLYTRLKRGLDVGEGEVDGAIRMAEAAWAEESDSTGASDRTFHVATRRRHVGPRSPAQADYIAALQSSELVFALGPAGTGKTYLAVAVAVSLMMQGSVDRIILSRPAVEAGERLGFLPGDMREKVDPYLRPLYDALYDMLPAEQVMRKIESGEIEVAPLAFMRGRTLANAFVILDEAQNCTPMQLKMFLTRLGENSRMVVTGDPSQVDLPLGSKSGLLDAVSILDGVAGVSLVHFTEADVVRHPLVTRIVRAYNASERDLLSDRSDRTPSGGKAGPGGRP